MDLIRDGCHLLRGVVKPNDNLEEMFSPLNGIAKDFLGSYYRDNYSTFTVSPPGLGISLHTDGIIQGTKQLVLVMWAPLTPCGEDAPGLAMVKADKASVLDYLRANFPGKKIPGWQSETEWNNGAFDYDAITKRFGKPWCPVMNPGDVMLFTNWTIHGTHCTPSMTKPRTAVVYRLKQRTLLQRAWDTSLRLTALR